MNGTSYDELKVLHPGSAEPSVNELIKPNNSLVHKFAPLQDEPMHTDLPNLKLLNNLLGNASIPWKPVTSKQESL